MEEQKSEVASSVTPVSNISTPLSNKPIEIRKSFSILNLMLTFVVLVLVGVSGFLAYQNMKLQKEINGIKSTSITASVSPSSIGTSDTSSWKTYAGIKQSTNPSYTVTPSQNLNFTINYPASWKVDDSSGWGVDFSSSDGNTNVEVGWLASGSGAACGSQTKPYTKASGLEGCIQSNSDGSTIYLLRKNDEMGTKIFWIDASSKISSVSDLQFIDQILSTFKFVSQSNTLENIKQECINLEGPDGWQEMTGGSVEVACVERVGKTDELSQYCVKNNGLYDDLAHPICFFDTTSFK